MCSGSGGEVEKQSGEPKECICLVSSVLSQQQMLIMKAHERLNYVLYVLF